MPVIVWDAFAFMIMIIWKCIMCEIIEICGKLFPNLFLCVSVHIHRSKLLMVLCVRTYVGKGQLFWMIQITHCFQMSAHIRIYLVNVWINAVTQKIKWCALCRVRQANNKKSQSIWKWHPWFYYIASRIDT